MTVKAMYDEVRFQFRNALVSVVILESVDEFTIQSTTFGPFEKGRELNLPRWIAEVLVSQQTARIKAVDIGPSDIQKALWRETSEPDLQKLTPDYFYKIKQHIAHLAKQNRQSPNQVRLAIQSKLERLLRDLIASRLLKLMKIALRENRIDEIKDNMTEEERWLVDRLAQLLRNWEEIILEVDSDS